MMDVNDDLNTPFLCPYEKILVGEGLNLLVDLILFILVLKNQFLSWVPFPFSNIL
jgi:hypothetical protein